ncbi:MAG: (2Fe-2S)-binding protein [Okeania sp. SIO1H6]|nr:(2Fe-2S)-binding protein [Okeania sp. SIO1H6]
MNQNTYNISFPDTKYPTLTLEKYSQLSQHLTVQNSPVLFGCRTGICGTCLVEVEGDIPPPNSEELEILEIFSPGNKQARLACQIKLTNNIKIIEEGRGKKEEGRRKEVRKEGKKEEKVDGDSL